MKSQFRFISEFATKAAEKREKDGSMRREAVFIVIIEKLGTLLRGFLERM